MRNITKAFSLAFLGGLVAVALLVAPVAGQMMETKGMHTSTPFAGPKANKGTVSHSKVNGKSTLTLSDDFVVPDTPDPHWRLVDSDGRVYDLDRLKIKDDKYTQSVEIPGYVKNVAKVVIWCAWAEANLGEASFSKPVK